MGELSKKIGEEGEKTVRQFFESIGWEPLTANIDLPCGQPLQHKHAGTNERSTHGIDLGFSYVCPLMPSYRRNILISVKNSNGDDTTPRKKQIKDELGELAIALNCFKDSPLKEQFLSEGGGPTESEDIGVLIKINKDPDGEKSFLGGLGTREQVEVAGVDPVCFIENSRFDFIEHSLLHLKANMPASEYSFLHSKNSLTASASTRKISTPILPVHNLVGGPLVLKVEDADNDERPSELVIYSNENFSAARLKRLAAIGLDISLNWVQVTIVFPDYQQVRDENTVTQVCREMAEKSFAKRIRCQSADLRSRRA